MSRCTQQMCTIAVGDFARDGTARGAHICAVAASCVRLRRLTSAPDMDAPKSSSYYFPGVVDVERAAVPDDEFDESKLDERLLRKLSTVPPEWRDAVLKAQDYGAVEVFDDDEVEGEEQSSGSAWPDEDDEDDNDMRKPQHPLYVSSDAHTKSHPGVADWNSRFWFETVVTANAKGWGWNGDTEVEVFYVHAQDPVDLLLSYLLARSPCYIEKRRKLDRSTVDSWRKFWDLGLCGYRHDLPDWPGAPREVIFLHARQPTIIAGEKEPGTYCVVWFDTS